MSINTAATVRMFGALHSVRKERGLPSTVEVELPAEGCSARDLAEKLELPLDKVQAVFVNHKAYTLQHKVKPGDRIGFIPRGVPMAPVFLGLDAKTT